MYLNDADGMANSVDTDQTHLGAVWFGSTLFAHLGAVWFWSTLFAQTCLSENLGTLQYFKYYKAEAKII